MQRVIKFATLFGVGLSAFAVVALIGAVSNAFFPNLNFQWGRRHRHPLDILGVLYLIGVLLLSQSKSRSAIISISVICTIGYLFLFGFIAWIIVAAVAK
jgi:hypothetical protein